MYRGVSAVTNNIIKITFSIVGAMTGFTLTKTFFNYQDPGINTNLKVAVYIAVSLSLAVLFYITANQVIAIILRMLDSAENTIQGMSLYEITISAAGLIAGLIVANLITIPINRIDIIGLPISVAANILFGCLGAFIAVGKRDQSLYEGFRGKKDQSAAVKGAAQPKLLDTSVIIDGRIIDICRNGFIEGELIVPGFILEELRHISDSADPLKRNRGRRGLDVLNTLQKDLEYPVRIENIDGIEGQEADDKLITAAKKLSAKIMTNDYNLNKVASFHEVPVLNINELANAMKPIALPGEDMQVQVIKDGKENGQGIGYLDDGTMIVVDGGKKHMGELVGVTVTSVIQTAAGRMIFAKIKSIA